ncbi:hypothetical protein [Flavobacterium microcysteis]
MNHVKSTSEILAFRVLNRNIDSVWINWAIGMLEEGYMSENLLYLAGENDKTNQFILQDIANKALVELGIDWSDKEKVINGYIGYLIEEALSGNRSYESVLENLKDLYEELENVSYLQDFYLLYFAQDDLKYEPHQYYWDNATKENITQVVEDYFIKRKLELKK